MPSLTLVLALGVLAVWVYLALFRGGFWRNLGPLASLAPPVTPQVVAIVPARNEAASIGACLNGLLAQDYWGDFSIVVVDDTSTDSTGEIAEQLAAAAGGRLTVIKAPPIQRGWTGKLWAQSQGIAHAKMLTGNVIGGEPRYYLLIDADIVLGAKTLSKMISKAENDGCEMVSQMVRLNCQHFWERLLIPAFVFFFAQLYPFRWVNDPRRRTAGAAGGCVLLRSSALRRIGGLFAIRGALIDDCTLADAVKRSGGKIWLGLAESSRSLREYSELDDVWDMVARTAYTQLRYSPLNLLMAVAGMTLCYLAPPILIVTLPLHWDYFASGFALLTCALIFALYEPMVLYHRLHWSWALTLPAAAVLYMLMTVDSARRHWIGRGGRWKGRIYSKGQAG
jgi:hopene-associated glycosyltransferase HpnB